MSYFFRWTFRLLCAWLAWLGLCAWIWLGSDWSPLPHAVAQVVGYSFYALPAGGLYLAVRRWRNRHLRRETKALARAFKDEVDEAGRKVAAPKVVGREAAFGGAKLNVMLPAGQTFRLPPLEKIRLEHRYASLLDCRSVSLTDNAMHGRRGTIHIHRMAPEPEPDYTGDLGPWPGWPGADDFSQPIPLGIAAKTGEPVGLRLFSGGMKNILVFGVPGSGKSVGAAEIIATAAQDPTVDLWGLDGGGGTDMEFWRHRMSHYEVKIEQAFLLIQELKVEIDRRSEAMVAAKRRVIDPHDPKILLVMEEFATFTDEKRKRCIATGAVRSSKEDDPSESFADAVAYVGRLGRKYGVGIVLITQVPTVKTIPGQLRGLVQYAWGFRCRDRGGWQAGFGGGVPFVRLDKSRPGTSILLAENDDPLLMRSYFISDIELEQIAAATSLAPVDSLAPATDTVSSDLCLENPENIAAPSEIPAAPDAAPYAPDSWDLAVLAAATDGRTGPDLYNNLVGGLSAGAARKRLKILTGAGYLSAPPRLKVTDPQLYMTTVMGREALKRDGVL